jgi:aminoglycoside phosphotransferase family enzyme/predicted kinase
MMRAAAVAPCATPEMSALSTAAPPSGYDLTGIIPADLLMPSAFPHPVGRLDVRETNISWIVLTGTYAYKIKKSVKLDFIDSSTLSKRHFLCEEELRLNRRLAAELYVDVVAITRDETGVRVGGDGQIIEYAVRMKQFDASEELSALLKRGAVSAREIADLAAVIAAFHASTKQAPPSINCVYTQLMHDAVLGNMAALLSHLDPDTQLPEMGALIDWTHDYLHDSIASLRAREQSGFIRECHGDLHARNVVRWCGRLTAFDCLEFDPKLRWIDVMNDVAFLVMDLSAHGRRDLGCTFLNAYLERSGDYAGVRLLPFYTVYRALVRAMVDSVGAERDAAHREDFRQRLRMRVRTAAAFIGAPAPVLLIMHGVSGSGKSFLSERLGVQLGAVRMRSDLERKRLAAGQPDAARAGFMLGIHTPEFSNRTYARLLECAQACLQGGVSVIVDAAFLNGEDRRMFGELAARHGTQFVIVSCMADPHVMAERIEMRRQAGIDPSDADVGVLDQQLENMQPLHADELLHTVTADTSQPFAYEKTLAAIQAQLARSAAAVNTNLKPLSHPTRLLS